MLAKLKFSFLNEIWFPFLDYIGIPFYRYVLIPLYFHVLVPIYNYLLLPVLDHATIYVIIFYTYRKYFYYILFSPYWVYLAYTGNIANKRKIWLRKTARRANLSRSQGVLSRLSEVFYINRLPLYNTYDIFLLKQSFNFFFKKINFRSNFRKKYFNSSSSFLYGFFNFFRHLSVIVIPVISVYLVVYYCLVIRSLPFLKISFELFCLFMLFYWLISGFVFFIKRYKYGKFTIAIQRFWRRTLAIFWLVESSTFLVFIYFLFNASQEPTLMFDIIQIQKTHLYSWKFFFLRFFQL